MMVQEMIENEEVAEALKDLFPDFICKEEAETEERLKYEEIFMATNDTILIDGILDDIISSNGMDDTNENRGKAFEDFAISELLKTMI